MSIRQLDRRPVRWSWRPGWARSRPALACATLAVVVVAATWLARGEAATGVIGPALLFPDATTAHLSLFVPSGGPSGVRLAYRPVAAGAPWTAVPWSAADHRGFPARTPGYTVSTGYRGLLDGWRSLLDSDLGDVRHYRFVLSGLAPATSYEYRLTRKGAGDLAHATFRTPPPAGTDRFRFAAFADLHPLATRDNRMQRVVRQRLREASQAGLLDFAILPGDVTNESGTAGQYLAHYFQTYQDLTARLPFYAIQGNHDTWLPGGGHAFANLFDLPPNPRAEQLQPGYPRVGWPPEYHPYYAFDWADARFFALDVSAAENYLKVDYFGRGTPQYRWLEEELAGSQSRRWRIVFFHVPPPPPGAPPDRAIRELMDLLQRYRVHLVLAGHYEYPELRVAAGAVPVVVLPSGGAGEADPAERCALRGRHKFGLYLADVSHERLALQGVDAHGEAFAELRIRQDAGGRPQVDVLREDRAGCATGERAATR